MTDRDRPVRPAQESDAEKIKRLEQENQALKAELEKLRQQLAATTPPSTSRPEQPQPVITPPPERQQLATTTAPSISPAEWQQLL